MTGYYWKKFSKRINSTKIPSNGTSIEFVIKKPTSIYEPVLLIGTEEDLFSNPIVYFSIDNLYYYVNDIISIRENIWELHLNIDVMASAKSDISNVNCYVSRAQSDNNNMLVDGLIDIGADIDVSSSIGNTNIFDGGECYILQVLDGSGGTSMGFMHTYAMTQDELAELALELTLPEAFEALNQGFADVSSCIGSSILLPVSSSKLSGGGATIKLGQFNTGVGAKNITSPVLFTNTVLNIPWKYNDFRKKSPFTSIRLYLPYIGVTEISANDIFEETSMNVYTSLDVITGVVAYSVQVGAGGRVIGEYSAKAGSTIPTSSYTANILGGITGSFGAIMSGGVSAATGNLVGLLGSIGGAINAGFDFVQHTAQIRGAQGSVAVNYTSLPYIRLDVISHSSSDEPSNISNVYGRPLAARRNISSLSGFIKCEAASIGGDWPSNIKSQINNIMNAGFYFE